MAFTHSGDGFLLADVVAQLLPIELQAFGRIVEQLAPLGHVDVVVALFGDVTPLAVGLVDVVLDLL